MNRRNFIKLSAFATAAVASGVSVAIPKGEKIYVVAPGLKKLSIREAMVDDVIYNAKTGKKYVYLGKNDLWDIELGRIKATENMPLYHVGSAIKEGE